MQGAASRWVRRKRARMVADEARAKQEAAPPPPPFSATAVAKAEQTRSHAEKLVSALAEASSDDARIASLEALREAAEEAYGADASALGAAVRDCGGIPALSACVGSLVDELRQGAMSLLGNLLTDVFDREARASLSLFAASGGLVALQRALGGAYPTNLFACATLQNVTSLDPFDTCTALRDAGCGAELGKLVGSEDATVASYATAVLANLRAYDPEPTSDDAVEEAIRARRLAAVVDQMREGRAIATMQGAASRWVRRKRS